MAVIDSTGVLSLIDISEDNVVKGSTSPETSHLFQRRDVWTMKWASDDPELLAIMEKTRMYVIRGLNPEEPISTSAYIASFEVRKNVVFIIIFVALAFKNRFNKIVIDSLTFRLERGSTELPRYSLAHFFFFYVL